MAIRETKLENGITVVTDNMPGVRSVALGFWFGVGSRDENPGQAGLTHFMEHMMFKGTSTRNAIEISEAFDEIGAESNAFTTKEYTCYHARMVDEKADEALSLITDMITDSQFRNEDIDTEREVVLEEIAESEDEPDDYAFELLNSAIWPAHPLGAPVLGSRQRVSAYRQEDCLEYHRQHYHRENLTVAAAGNVNDEALAYALARLDLPRHGGAPRVSASEVGKRRLSFVAQKRDIEQAHIIFGFPWLCAGDSRRFEAALLVSILGGSASSRLFREIREKEGLAYSVFAGASCYRDAGLAYIYCATRPENLSRISHIARTELERIVQDPPSRNELARACEVECGQLLMGMESTENRMARIGRRATMGLEQLPVDDMVARYRAVTPEMVCDTARDLLTSPPTIAVVSPFDDDHVQSLVG